MSRAIDSRDLALTQRHISSQRQYSPNQVPRLVVTELTHQVPIGYDCRAEKNDEWKQTHRRVKSRISSSELKVHRDVINGQETGCIAAGRGDEKQIGLFDFEQMYRKHAVRGCREPGKPLLNCECNKEDPGDDEERNNLAAVPIVQSPPEVDCHDEAENRAN